MENGTGTATVLTENFDSSGYWSSTVDGGGTVTGYTFSKIRGVMTQLVEDQGRLNLTTDYTPDNLGRIELRLGPAHDIDLGGTTTTIRRARWNHYLDVTAEHRTFAGYRKTAGSVDQIVGPVTIVRLSDTLPPGYAGFGYRQVSRIDATYGSAGIPSATTSFPQNTWVRWTAELYSKANQVDEEWKYSVIPPSGHGSQTANYGKKGFGYDSGGRLNLTICAGGTIDKTTFNAMGWTVQEELGTSAGLTTTRTNEYYDNGGLKQVTLYAATNRVVDKTYDYRNRLVEDKTTVEKDGGGTWTLYTLYAYNNRDLVTSITNYHTSLSNKTGLQTNLYDALDRRYRHGLSDVNSSGVSTFVLTSSWYYDAAGRLAREAPAGTRLTTVSQYDAVGRVAAILKAAGSFSTSDPSSTANATVIEQEVYGWDNGGNLIRTTAKERFDAATGNGPLNSPTAEPRARISYIAFYPDALGREQARADYGTNGAAAWTRPATMPARSDTVLVTSTSYNAAGNVSATIDPDARETRPTFDAADRLTILVENYQASPGNDTRTTRYEYTDDGWLKKLLADNATTGQQITEWVYGVTTAQGSSLYSNRLVYQKKYPDFAGGSDLVTFKYNQQQEVTGITDQLGTVHAYAYDTLGRLLTDTATTFGSGVDNTINKLENAYNERGLLLRVASYNTSGGTKANEVSWVYNSFNQPTSEYQEHTGAVTGLRIQYSYADGSTNTIRQTGITSPNNTTITTEYLSSLNNALSRPDAIKESGSTLASFKYLGWGTLIDLKYDGASNANLLFQNGGTGDAGDIYTGLDRFGRLVETLWKTGSTELVHTSYGRNRASGVKWKRDVLGPCADAHPGHHRRSFLLV